MHHLTAESALVNLLLSVISGSKVVPVVGIIGLNPLEGNLLENSDKQPFCVTAKAVKRKMRLKTKKLFTTMACDPK